MLCPILRKIKKQLVQFDPENREHIKAFEYMCLGENGVFRQHPVLRFELEEGFVDVRSMMLYKVGRAWIQLQRAADESVKRMWEEVKKEQPLE